jgi:hypothetical protein
MWFPGTTIMLFQDSYPLFWTHEHQISAHGCV